MNASDDTDLTPLTYEELCKRQGLPPAPPTQKPVAVQELVLTGHSADDVECGFEQHDDGTRRWVKRVYRVCERDMWEWTEHVSRPVLTHESGFDAAARSAAFATGSGRENARRDCFLDPDSESSEMLQRHADGSEFRRATVFAPGRWIPHPLVTADEYPPTPVSHEARRRRPEHFQPELPRPPEPEYERIETYVAECYDGKSRFFRRQFECGHERAGKWFEQVSVPLEDGEGGFDAAARSESFTGRCGLRPGQEPHPEAGGSMNSYMREGDPNGGMWSHEHGYDDGSNSGHYRSW